MAGYGFKIRLVHSHVRLVLLAIADVRGKGVVLGVAVGPPYASEDRRTYLPALPVVGDRGYDAVDILERLQSLGAQPALQMKAT